MEVIRAGAQWKEEILRFADRIFGEDVQPGGFAELIPDVYGPEAPCDGNHLLVLEEGKIRALRSREQGVMGFLHHSLIIDHLLVSHDVFDVFLRDGGNILFKI